MQVKPSWRAAASLRLRINDNMQNPLKHRSDTKLKNAYYMSPLPLLYLQIALFKGVSPSIPYNPPSCFHSLSQRPKLRCSCKRHLCLLILPTIVALDRLACSENNKVLIQLLSLRSRMSLYEFMERPWPMHRRSFPSISQGGKRTQTARVIATASYTSHE